MEQDKQEDYFWVAQVNDGRMLQEEFGDTFKDVMDLNMDGKIEYFILVMSNDKHSKIVTKLGGKRKLIFFRRRMNHVCDKGKFSWNLTAVGWEQKVGRTVIKSLCFIYPNGSIELNNDEPTLAAAYHESFIKSLQESNP